MAAKKKETGLHGYPVTRFQGPGGKHDYVDVTNAVTEHNLRAAGYVPAKGHAAPTETQVAQAAAKEAEAVEATPHTTTQTSR